MNKIKILDKLLAITFFTFSMATSEMLLAQNIETFTFEQGKVYVDLHSNDKRNFKADGTRMNESEKIAEIKSDYAKRKKTITEDNIVFLTKDFVEQLRQKAVAERKHKKGKLDAKYQFLWGDISQGKTVTKADLEKKSINEVIFKETKGKKFKVVEGTVRLATLKDVKTKSYDFYTVPVLEGGKLTEETLESISKAQKAGGYVIFKDLIVQNGTKKFKVPTDFKFVFQ